ncbi:MAG TPA: helix-turn-helix domain-containing protein [Bacillus bacterium]|nr:helix-turn-helix domain-containing protein [Bacillus sp. (in: firmicutes)]
MTFGQRLKDLRNNEGISMDGLAKTIGTSSSRISDWENEKTHPSSVFVVKIARYFNVSIDWLLTGEEYKNSDATISKSGNILTQSEDELINIPPIQEHQEKYKEAIKDLTPEEKELIHILRELDPKDGIEVKTIIRMKKDLEQQFNKPTKSSMSTSEQAAASEEKRYA